MHSCFLKHINHGVFQFFFLIFIKLSLIEKSNLISLKINYVSLPILSLNQAISNSTLRNLPEQYVYGSSFKINYYYSNLYLGEKMHKQGYILDTGSTITTATCDSLCKHCGLHISPHYNAEDLDKKIILCTDPICKQVSSRCNYSSKPRECSFVISYSEGSSLNGVYINEIVRFSGIQMVSILTVMVLISTEDIMMITMNTFQEKDGMKNIIAIRMNSMMNLLVIMIQMKKMMDLEI